MNPFLAMDAAILKEKLVQFNAQQKADFPAQSILSLLQQRSRFYDTLLDELWQQLGLSERDDLALIAVGGYGRQEMFPLSDLDILVLTEQPLDQKTHNKLNHLFNLLWDSKLQLGSAVRTLDECIAIGKQELSVATNMLESRFLLGNTALWQQLMEHLFQPDFWDIHTFFTAKMQEKTERYARYHNTGYNLEPDLKHSPGGLRDLHLLSWIMLRHYGVSHLEGLTQKGILYPEEFTELTRAQNTLFKMRFALHLQLKRYDNRLRFDRQLQLSEQLGYQGEGNQPVEKMMKDFFQATQSILQLSRLVLTHFEQTVISPLQKKGEKQPLDPLFSLRDNRIYCENPRIFTAQPHAILDLFYHLTRQPTATADTHTLRHLRLALQKQTQHLCFDPLARERFISLFSQPNAISRAILPMHELGVLNAYIPQWHAIQGLMQFDLFHIYTVDEHTIRVMLNLEQFLHADSQAQFPLCYQLFPQLPQREQLYLAALFHDIAKGRHGDHAQNGAKDMREFAELHGFSVEECEYMAWLVAEHLTMSITAQRRDIHDPEVVKHFAEKVANPTALSALTCLTVADIHGTHDTLWNDWKRTLFTQLYQLTLTQFTDGNNKSNMQQLANIHRQQALEQIKFVLSRQDQQRLDHFWASCPESYFMRHKPTQLVWHALHYLKQTQLPLVLASNQYARAATELFIHCDDQPQLFARIAHTLSQKKINILDAQILTSDTGAVLDSFIVTDQYGQALDNERIQHIQTELLKTLSQPNNHPFSVLKKPVKYRSFKRKTRLRFLATNSPKTTAFELFTLDREGLLAQLGDIFNRLELNLLNAKISTIGERVEDFFVISTQAGGALSDKMREKLEAQIFEELAE